MQILTFATKLNKTKLKFQQHITKNAKCIFINQFTIVCCVFLPNILKENCNLFRTSLPGRFYELNIHFGVFVGGMGDFNEIFLGNQKNFRGCLENVFFNNIEVMAAAEEAAAAGESSAQLHNVAWDCSEEFEAAATEAVSFVSADSFISFPSWIPRSGATLAVSVKTAAADAVLAYNSGHANSNDFVALEIRNKKVRLLLDQAWVYILTLLCRYYYTNIHCLPSKISNLCCES